MNVIKLGQEDDGYVYGWVAVDEKGNRVSFLEPNQNLGKKCDKLINSMAPGQGAVGHHAEYNQGDQGMRKAPVKDHVLAR